VCSRYDLKLVTENAAPSKIHYWGGSDATLLHEKRAAKDKNNGILRSSIPEHARAKGQNWHHCQLLHLLLQYSFVLACLQRVAL
jgi:hypothetical protein